VDPEDTGDLDRVSLDKGVVWGIMACLRDKKQDEAQVRISRDIGKYRIVEALEKVDNAIGLVFDTVKEVEGGVEYWRRLQETGIAELSVRVSEFLEEVKEEE
jgi:hypothetical protein